MRAVFHRHLRSSASARLSSSAARWTRKRSSASGTCGRYRFDPRRREADEGPHDLQDNAGRTATVVGRLRRRRQQSLGLVNGRVDAVVEQRGQVVGGRSGLKILMVDHREFAGSRDDEIPRHEVTVAGDAGLGAQFRAQVIEGRSEGVCLWPSTQHSLWLEETAPRLLEFTPQERVSSRLENRGSWEVSRDWMALRISTALSNQRRAAAPSARAA